MLKSWIIVPFIAIALALAAWNGAGFSHRLLIDPLALFAIVFQIALLSFPPLLLGGLTLEIMLRLKWGGWVTALVIGAAISVLTVRALTGSFSTEDFGLGVITLMGMIYGGTLWLALRFQVPRAFSS